MVGHINRIIINNFRIFSSPSPVNVNISLSVFNNWYKIHNARYSSSSESESELSKDSASENDETVDKMLQWLCNF